MDKDGIIFILIFALIGIIAVFSIWVILLSKKVKKLQENLKEEIEKSKLRVKKYADKVVEAALDPLTELYNRGTLDEGYEKAWLFASEKKTSIAVAMIDIDNFKKYNDTYGHQKGDECLKTIASILKEHSAEENFIAGRYGGEEFMLVYVGFSEDEVFNSVNKIKNEILLKNIPHEKNIPWKRVSISIGIEYIAEDKEIPIAGKIIALSDKALYKSKENGRNAITVSTRA